MTEVNKPVRIAFMQALDGTITIDGTPVPAYAEENPNEAESLYIVFNTQTEEDNSNKGRFQTEGTILIDVVHKSLGTSFDTVDRVASAVMNKIQPTPTTNGLTNPNGLQIINVSKLSSATLYIPQADTHILRRLIRYGYTVVEDVSISGFTI